MNTFYMPINLNKWNLFARRVDDIEDFLYIDGMKVGDLLLLYVSQKGLDDLRKDKPDKYKNCPIKSPGIYACARVISLPYTCADDNDYLFDKEVIDAKIILLSRYTEVIRLQKSPNGVEYTKPKKMQIGMVNFA